MTRGEGGTDGRASQCNGDANHDNEMAHEGDGRACQLVRQFAMVTMRGGRLCHVPAGADRNRHAWL